MTSSPAALVAVHPHPDDESIAAGLTLLHYADLDVATHVITCTGGEAGENLAGIDLDLPMARQRREEMAAAAQVLGLTSHTWLGYRDSGMVGTADNDHPDAFTNVDVPTAARRLAGHLRRLRPQVVISDDAQGTYGHPDHIMSNRVTVAAVAAAADPDADVAGAPHQVRLHVAHALPVSRLRRMHDALVSRGRPSPFRDEDIDDFGTPDDQVLTTISAPHLVAAKRRAMLAHRSQVSTESAFFNLPEDVFGEALGVEQFIAVWSARPLGDEDRDALEWDLFGGWLS